MAGVALVNGFGAMGDSFMRAFQGEKDRQRKQVAQDNEQAWTQKVRGRQEKAWSVEDQEQELLAEAFKSAAPDISGATGQAAGGVQTDGVVSSYPGAARAGQSPVYQSQMRAAEAIQAINPKRAMELRNSAIQTRSSELGLQKEEQALVDDSYNRLLVDSLNSEDRWYDGAAKTATQWGGGKLKLEPVLSPDGKKVSLYAKGEDGEGGRLVGTYDSGEDGKMEFLNKSLRQDTKTKMAVLQANMQYERSRRDKTEDREADLGGRERLAKFEHGLALSRDASRDARDARNRGVDSAKASEMAAAGLALFKQNNPNATSAELEAVRVGLLSAVPKEPKGGYKVEAGDVATLLGTPATDPQGRPLMDPMTGRQVVNRNPDKERELFEFMRDNNITDTNEALQKFLAPRGGAKPAPGPKKIDKGQVVNGYEFLGGDPKDEKRWRQVSAGKAN